jgi:hypothetical protein
MPIELAALLVVVRLIIILILVVLAVWLIEKLL